MNLLTSIRSIVSTGESMGRMWFPSSRILRHGRVFKCPKILTKHWSRFNQLRAPFERTHGRIITLNTKDISVHQQVQESIHQNKIKMLLAQAYRIAAAAAAVVEPLSLGTGIVHLATCAHETYLEKSPRDVMLLNSSTNLVHICKVWNSLPVRDSN